MAEFPPKLLFYRTGEGLLIRVYCCIKKKKRIFTVNSDIFLSCWGHFHFKKKGAKLPIFIFKCRLVFKLPVGGNLYSS